MLIPLDKCLYQKCLRAAATDATVDIVVTATFFTQWRCCYTYDLPLVYLSLNLGWDEQADVRLHALRITREVSATT